MPRAKRICAWCGEFQGMTESEDFPEGAETHGVCDECSTKLVTGRSPCRGCLDPERSKCGVVCREGCQMLDLYQRAMAQRRSEPSLGVVDMDHDYAVTF